jgi:1-deoxy-D-xylulose-5-phosphate reductoisomerase
VFARPARHGAEAAGCLTASGGPFRGRSAAQLESVSAEDALKHPTWRMGRKITVDSATLMNKGLEVIEAHWLFGVAAERIQVLVHPQSVVHSLVELVDGSMIAQLGITDMRLPIQYAFSYPERWTSELPSLDLARAGQLDFGQPDTDAFPCLRLAYRALESERSLPVVMNAANEVAVAKFLEGRLGFSSFPRVIERSMDAHRGADVTTIEEVRAVDEWARAYSQAVAREVELKV